jgi:hypothetical protein
MRIIAVALIAVSLGCGHAGAQSSQSAGGAKTADGTALPECDKYIRMVSECIATKVPESERADEQARLDSFRDVLTHPMLTAFAANGTCKENIRHEWEQDRYGCYTNEAKAAGIKTACSFITAAELEAILKVPMKEPVRDESKCHYAPEKGMSTATIEVHRTRGRDEMDGARSGLRIMTKRMKKDVPDIDPTGILEGETILGLGDDAFFMTAGVMPFLYVRKGDASFNIEGYGDTKEQMIAIARTVLSRFP